MIVKHLYIEKEGVEECSQGMKDIHDSMMDEDKTFSTDLISTLLFSDQFGIYSPQRQVHAGEKDTVSLKCRICNTLPYHVSNEFSMHSAH